MGVKGSLDKLGMTPFFLIFWGRDDKRALVHPMPNERVRCLGLRMTRYFIFYWGREKSMEFYLREISGVISVPDGESWSVPIFQPSTPIIGG